MGKKCVSLLFAICFVAVLLITPAYGQQAMKTVKIGVISPLSGPLTFVGTSMLRCVQMAVNQVNEKGTLGNNGPGLLIGKERYTCDRRRLRDNLISQEGNCVTIHRGTGISDVHRDVIGACPG